jgi:regulatory protein
LNLDCVFLRVINCHSFLTISLIEDFFTNLVLLPKNSILSSPSAMPKEQVKYSPEEAFLKAAHYCAYQERCHNEVVLKLGEWGVYGMEAQLILSKLIEQNYLNEERFAKAFAGGKFRVKQWGRLKIKRELKVRGVSDFCINEAMKEIETEDYLETLKDVIEKKMATFKSLQLGIAKKKVYHYAATKGFESDLIWDCLNA